MRFYTAPTIQTISGANSNKHIGCDCGSTTRDCTRRKSLGNSTIFFRFKIDTGSQLERSYCGLGPKRRQLNLLQGCGCARTHPFHERRRQKRKKSEKNQPVRVLAFVLRRKRARRTRIAADLDDDIRVKNIGFWQFAGASSCR